MIEAHWISPSGKVIPVKTTHIQTVTKNPKLYGTTLKAIQDEYKKYGEKFPEQEGKAREKIMINIIKKGWTRVRLAPRGGRWVLEFWNLTHRMKDNIWSWAYEISNHGKKPNGLAKLVSIAKSKVVGSSTINNILHYTGDVFENKKYTGKTLQEIVSIKMIKNIIQEELQNLKEKSLSRVWQHINDPKRSFAVISAYLSNDPKNDLNHKQLAKDVRKAGSGYIELDSGYTYKSAKGGKEKIASEKSYFIPNISKKTAIKLAQKYDQESILWKDGSEFILLGTRSDVGVGKKLMNFRTSGKGMTFNSSTVKTAFSALQKGSKNQVGRKFAFVAERRSLDFPTSYLYQGQKEIVPEWIEII